MIFLELTVIEVSHFNQKKHKILTVSNNQNYNGLENFIYKTTTIENLINIILKRFKNGFLYTF